MDVKIPVFVICVEAIMYLFLYGLHDCTFNAGAKICFLGGSHFSFKSALTTFTAQSGHPANGWRVVALPDDAVVGDNWLAGVLMSKLPRLPPVLMTSKLSWSS